MNIMKEELEALLQAGGIAEEIGKDILLRDTSKMVISMLRKQHAIIYMADEVIDKFISELNYARCEDIKEQDRRRREVARRDAAQFMGEPPKRVIILHKKKN